MSFKEHLRFTCPPSSIPLIPPGRLIIALLLGLAAMASTAFGNTLYVPFVRLDGMHLTSVAIANTTNTAGQVTLTLYKANGDAVGQADQTLSAGGQLIGLVRELVGVSGDVTGWLKIDSSVEVAALGFLIYIDFSADYWQVNPTPVVRTPDLIQVFPYVAIGSGWQTQVAVANTAASPASAKAVLYDSIGNLIAVQQFTVSASGFSLLDIGTLFGINNLSGGHVEIDAGQSVVTSEVLMYGGYVAATVGGQRLIAPGLDGKWTQFFPLLTSDSDHSSTVAYVNQSGAPSLVTASLFANDGSLVATRTDLIAGKAQELYLLGDLAKGWQGTGYLRVSADAGLASLVIAATIPSGPLTMVAWNGQSESGTELHIANIAESEGYASDLGLVNLNPVQATIEVDALDQAGNTLSTATTTLGPNQQLHAKLASLLSIAGHAGGSVRITSSTSIAVADLFGGPAGFAGASGLLPSDLVERTIPGVLLATQSVGPNGGQVQIASPLPNDPLGRLHLTIPPGALDRDTEIELLLTLPTIPNPDRRLVLQQYPIRLLPSGLQFKLPVRLTIPVSPEVIQSAAQLRSLSALTYDEATATWQSLPILSYDTAANTVDVQIQHFSWDILQTLLVPGNSSCPLDTKDKIDTVFGSIPGLANGVRNLLGKTQWDGLGDFTDIINAAYTGVTIGQQFESGDYACALQSLSTWSFETAGHGICESFLKAQPQLNYLCSAGVDVVVNALVNLSVGYADYMGQLTFELQADFDARTTMLQFGRYLQWRGLGYSQGSVPTCKSGWFANPVDGSCGNLDNYCFWGASNFPCGATAYTPGFVANAGDLTIGKEREAVVAAQQLQAALVTAAEQLIAQYGQGTLSGEFTVQPSIQGPAPFAITTLASSSASGLSYVWDFGDNTRLLGGPTSSHVYASPGLYTIALTVQDPQTTQAAQSSQVIGVLQAPPTTASSGPATIAASVTTVAAPGTVAINASGFDAGAAVNFYWAAQNGPASSSGVQRAGGNGTVAYTISFPAGSVVGPYSVYAQEMGGLTSNTLSIAVTGAPPPSAGAVLPSQGTLGPSGLPAVFQVVVSGSGFTAGCSVQVTYAHSGSYGGQPYNAGDLVGIVPGTVQKGGAQVSAPLQLGQGDFNLKVVNPDQQQSQPVLFVVSLPSIQPSISEIQPSHVSVGQPTTLAVTGTGFQYGFTASVSTSAGSFNIASNGLAFISPTLVQVQVKMSATPIPPYPATLTIADPGGYTATGTFTVAPSGASGGPTLTTNPASGPQGTTFTNSGSGITPNGQVQRFIQNPGQSGFTQISNIAADGNGNFSWTYPTS